jgi:hypothetical protein
MFGKANPAAGVTIALRSVYSIAVVACLSTAIARTAGAQTGGAGATSSDTVLAPRSRDDALRMLKVSLRDIYIAQEERLASSGKYSSSMRELNATLPKVVAVTKLLVTPSGAGWAAVVEVEGFPDLQCGLGRSRENPIDRHAIDGLPSCTPPKK